MRDDNSVFIVSNDNGSETRTNLAFDPTDPGILRTTDFETIESSTASPEECVIIRRRTATELSDEAACILKTILSVPNEITSKILENSPQIKFPETVKKVNILSKSGKPSKIKIRRFLIGKFHEPYINSGRTNWPSPDKFINDILKEIEAWLYYL